MTLRVKMLLTVLALVVGSILLLNLMLRTLILNSYSALEQQLTLRDLNRAGSRFQDSADRLVSGLADWSSWDDTYEFVQDGNADYVTYNLMDDTFWLLEVNLMMFVNNSNEIVYAKMVSLDEEEQAQLLAAFEDTARNNNRFLRLMKSAITAGYVVIGGEPMIVASRPILKSDHTGPQAGTLIWARHLDRQELTAASASLSLSVALFEANDSSLPGDVLAAQQAFSPASTQLVRPTDENLIRGYALLNDIYDTPALILRTTQDREIYHQGQATMTYFFVALVLVGSVFGVGSLLLLERQLLAPLSRLSERVSHIGVNDNFSMRLPVEGRDELAQLAVALNTMLSTVSESRAALQELNVGLERRVTERTTELEDQKSQLHAIMDAMGEGLVYCVDGLIQYVNDAFSELLDFPVRELVGKTFQSLTNQPDVNQTSPRYETALTRRDGTAVNVAVTSMPVDVFDDHRRSVIIIRDITQELKAKTQKKYFFARASHDLRSPLTSIMTRLYLLEQKPEELDRHLKSLNRTSDRMLQLVNDLLDVSRAGQGALTLKRRDLVLQTIIDDAAEVLQADAEMRNVFLRTEMEGAPLQVNVDPLRMNQVITNLVVNAIHYTPEGGDIVVKVETADLNGAKRAVIRIADSGIGISPENLEHIFDPFFRVDDNRETGSGLGLVIVKEIVELHGGEVKVESQIGKGTTFSVYLALSDGNPENGETQFSANGTPSTHSPANEADKSPVR